MSKNIDHKYTGEIVCPYCGYVFIDSWEYGDDEYIGLIECHDCEKTFHAQRNIEVTYTTERYGHCEKCGKDNQRLEKAPYIFNGYVCGTCWKKDYIKHKKVLNK